MEKKTEVKCIIDELPDRRIGMDAVTHSHCPKCHPEKTVKHTSGPVNMPWIAKKVPGWGPHGSRFEYWAIMTADDENTIIDDPEMDEAKAVRIVSDHNAAPELLEAVKKLHHTFGPEHPASDRCSFCKLIAKAEVSKP